MKKIYFLSIALLLLTSCNNGMNKSILEPLTVDELKSNIKKDESFTDFYSGIQEIREFIMKSDVTQAKYADITYKRVHKYMNKISDTTFIKEFEVEQKALYEKQYPDYSYEVDSILTYWKEYKDKYSLDSFVTIEFDELWKEHYSYSGDVKNVNIGFKVTPLKGTIEQLIFRYCIKSKISNDGSMSLLNSHRCLASSPISSPRTLHWEADYSDEKYLKHMTSSQVRRDYDFNIEIEEVRVNGENMSEKIEDIPSSVSSALRWDDMREYYTADIVKEFIDPSYVSFQDFYHNAILEKQKMLDSEVFEMLKECDEF